MSSTNTAFNAFPTKLMPLLPFPSLPTFFWFDLLLPTMCIREFQPILHEYIFISNGDTPFVRRIICIFRFFSLTPLNRRRLRDPLFKRLFITFKTASTASGLSKNSFCQITHPQLSRPLHANTTLMQKALNLTSAVNCFGCSYFYSCGQLLLCSFLRSSRELDSRRSIEPFGSIWTCKR